nr:topoisomerase DNA-binding C4 zinc finger domain-containing protein [Sorangium cellulosum]
MPLGVACPNCGGDLIEIRPRKKGGRTFYGCSNWNAEQKCDFKLWQKPVPVPCPQCGAKFVTRTGGKKAMLVCATKDCGFKQEIAEGEGEEGAADGSAPLDAAAIVASAAAAPADRPEPPEPAPADRPEAAPKGEAEKPARAVRARRTAS